MVIMKQRRKFTVLPLANNTPSPAFWSLEGPGDGEIGSCAPSVIGCFPPRCIITKCRAKQ